MKLTKNFSLKELTASQTAVRLGILQQPTEEQLVYLTNLCCNILQPIRDHFGKVLTVSSGFRSPDLSEAVGSKKTSEHCCIDSAAADFELFGIDNKLTAQFIQAELDYNQLILEHYSPPNGCWIHCSYRIEGNKKKAMHAFKEDGKTVYKEGLWH